MIFPATIITSDDADNLNQALESLASELNNNFHINNPDIFTIDQNTGWGIDQVRTIKNFLSQKPLKHDTKIVLIRDAHNLGTESQNALLKTLEEPPSNSYIILCTSQSQALLPTVLSRCHTIVIKKTYPKKEIELLKPLPTIQENLVLSEKIASNKEEVLPYLQTQLIAYQQQLIKDPALAPLVRKLIRTIQMVKANVDPKAALDWFLLS